MKKSFEMIRLSALVFVITASMATLPGCSTKYLVPADEVQLNKSKKYFEVVFPSRITGVVLPTKDTTDNLLETVGTASPDDIDSTSERIIFDENCGSLDTAGYSVTGVTSDDDSVKILLDDVFFVEFSNTGLPRSYMTPDAILRVCESAKLKPEKAIDRAEVPYWDVVSFDRQGGRYDPSVDKIYGKSNVGSVVNIDLNDVHYVRYKKFNPFKTTRAGLLTVTLAAFAQGIFDIFDL